MAKRRISARALRFLFASGVLRGKGSGKNRTVTYDKARAATISRNRKRGVDVTSRKKASQVNKSGRHVFGGSKAARLRSGSAPARRVPSKAERDATREARLEASRKTLLGWAARQAGDYRSKVPTPKKGSRKEMESMYGGKYADTGQPFKRGDKIFYEGGKAYSTQAAPRKPRIGELSIKPRKGVNSAQLAAASVVKQAVGGDTGQRTSYRTVAGFRKRFQRELQAVEPGRQFGQARAATPRPRLQRPKIGEGARRDTDRILQGVNNRNMFGASGNSFDRDIARMPRRTLEFRVETLRRKNLPVTPEALGGNARQFSQRLKKAAGVRDTIATRRKGINAYGARAGFSKPEVIGGRIVDMGRR